MTIVAYDRKYDVQLAYELCDYFKELYGDDYVGKPSNAMDVIHTWYNNRHIIYLLLDDGGNVVGFVSMYLFDMYGMTSKYLVVDHMYIKPSYRSGRGIVYLYASVGYIMDFYEVDAKGITVSSSSNVNNNKIVGGEEVAIVTDFKRDTILNKYKKYMNKLGLKGNN